MPHTTNAGEPEDGTRLHLATRRPTPGNWQTHFLAALLVAVHLRDARITRLEEFNAQLAGEVDRLRGELEGREATGACINDGQQRRAA